MYAQNEHVLIVDNKCCFAMSSFFFALFLNQFKMW